MIATHIALGVVAWSPFRIADIWIEQPFKYPNEMTIKHIEQSNKKKANILLIVYFWMVFQFRLKWQVIFRSCGIHIFAINLWLAPKVKKIIIRISAKYKLITNLCDFAGYIQIVFAVLIYVENFFQLCTRSCISLLKTNEKKVKRKISTGKKTKI